MSAVKTLALIFVVLAGAAVAAGCGGIYGPDSPLATPLPATETPTQTPAVTEAPPPTTPPAATLRPPEIIATREPTAPSAGDTATPEPTIPPNPEDQIAQGEIIFQQTAGGIGCQACHAKDAKGLVGPGIRGRIASQVAGALMGVDAMSFIILTEEEIEAVAAYLQTLK